MRVLLPILTTLGLLLAMASACDDDKRGEPDKCDVYCPTGTAFPCPCSAFEGCYDGSNCSGIADDHTFGFCALPCTSNSDCVTDIECTGQAQCVLTTPSGMACAYVCEGDWDCPKEMSCIAAGNGKLCYPSEQPDAG
jgi:hypothetical protein